MERSKSFALSDSPIMCIQSLESDNFHGNITYLPVYGRQELAAKLIDQHCYYCSTKCFLYEV